MYVEIGQHGSREFFEGLRADAAARGLLEADFSLNLRSQFHELFWEIYLAGALLRAGFALKRGNAKLREPDYRFAIGRTTIFIEAVACGDPSDLANRVIPPSQEDDSDFEDGIAKVGHSVQRLAQAIDYKIQAVTRPSALAAMNAHGPNFVVIAVNGCRALNGHPHNDPGIPFLPFVAQALFGATEQRMYSDGRVVWICASRMNKTPEDTKSFPVGHFTDRIWTTKDRKTGAEICVPTTHIAGVVYSQSSADHTAVPLGDDFVFIQNPHGPDATELFRFCKGGRWVREGDALRRL